MKRSNPNRKKTNTRNFVKSLLARYQYHKINWCA